MKSVSKTFRLDQQTVQALQELVEAGRAPTQTALIEALIAREKVRLDMQREERDLDSAWEVAMSDESYRSEMCGIMADFAEADAEVARLIK